MRYAACLGTAVIGVWAVTAAVSGLRTARSLPPDIMSELESEFRTLAKDLPPAGAIGFLERYENAGDDVPVRVRYAAQYALVPRVVQSRVGPEFIVAPAGNDRPGGDSRLDGYFLISMNAYGHRVFRRLSL